MQAVVTSEETVYDKVVKFTKENWHKIAFCLAGACCFRIGKKIGTRYGYLYGLNRGFGLGSAAACDIILDVRPEERETFMKTVMEAWSMK